MRTTYIYTKPGETCKICEGNKPLMLYITFETGNGSPEVTISGSENPFPFKKIIIKKWAADFDKWLLEKGWVKAGHCYN